MKSFLQCALMVVIAAILFASGMWYKNVSIRAQILSCSKTVCYLPSLDLTISAPHGRLLIINEVE